MNGLFRRTSGGLMAAFGLLVIGGAVAYAQHSITSTGSISGPVNATAKPTGNAVPQEVTNRPVLKISLTGTIERDNKKLSVDKAGPVKPGEVVSFTMNSVNEGSGPAHDYRAVGQVPRGSSFVAGSALGERVTHVSYSIDGGQNFSAMPVIDERQTDGSLKKVAAPVALYTQVRFEWSEPLAAGGNLSASYQVRVR